MTSKQKTKRDKLPAPDFGGLNRLRPDRNTGADNRCQSIVYPGSHDRGGGYHQERPHDHPDHCSDQYTGRNQHTAGCIADPAAAGNPAASGNCGISNFFFGG